MKIEQTGRRSAAETDREPWEPCSACDEIGMTVFYLAERLCAAFLMSGLCNRCLLAAADYCRARRKRLAHVRPGFRKEGNTIGRDWLQVGQAASYNAATVGRMGLIIG